MEKIIKRIISKFKKKVSKAKPGIKGSFDDSRSKTKKRFEPYECTFLNHTLYVHDQDSFYLGYNELFKENIYKFKADNDQPYIIDCGANLGMSVIYFKSLYPNAEITAFEADPHIFSFLQKNIKSFNFSKVDVISRAVWNSSDDCLSFLSEGGAGGRLQEKLTGHTFIEVKTIRLKNFLNKKVDFLKIDIEGAEYNVIKDCAQALKNVQNLFIEYHSFPEVTQNLHLILAIVQEAGFCYHIKEAFTSSEPFMERKLNFNMDLQLNIFCYRS